MVQKNKEEKKCLSFLDPKAARARKREIPNVLEPK